MVDPPPLLQLPSGQRPPTTVVNPPPSTINHPPSNQRPKSSSLYQSASSSLSYSATVAATVPATLAAPELPSSSLQHQQNNHSSMQTHPLETDASRNANLHQSGLLSNFVSAAIGATGSGVYTDTTSSLTPSYHHQNTTNLSHHQQKVLTSIMHQTDSIPLSLTSAVAAAGSGSYSATTTPVTLYNNSRTPLLRFRHKLTLKQI